MPMSAWALVALFTACSIALGVLAAWIVGRSGGPPGRAAAVLPVVAAFGAFYVIGHKLGLSIGPEVSLFGFQVALVGDLALGFAAAMVVARCRQGRASPAWSGPGPEDLGGPGSSPVATGRPARVQSLYEPA